MDSPLSESEKQAQQLILDQVNNALDLLEAHLHKYCNDVAPQFTGSKATSVPMIYITESMKIIKENMAKGAGSASKTE